MKKQIKKIETNSFDFSFDNFVGPLDLLLHLAKTNEIEISDLSLDHLIDQYLIFIEQVNEKGVDIASSYLEMAAELIRLKSQMLLPNAMEDEEFIQELEDLGLDRDTLIAKLLEYKKYKEVIPKLSELIDKRNCLLTRAPEKLKAFRTESFKNSITMDEFVHVTKLSLQHELSNRKETKIIDAHEIGTEKYIEEFSTLTHEFCFEKRILTYTKPNIIALFLALLESLKLHYVSIDYRDGLIYVTKYMEDNEH